jgi:hypothetical protein
LVIRLVIGAALFAALAGIGWWVLFVDQGGPSPREMARREARELAQEKARRGPCRDQAREVRAYRSGRAVLKAMGENQ